MRRILSIPAKPDNDWGGWPVFDWLYRCGNADDCPLPLNKLQRIALSTMQDARGLLGMLPVGWGKTLINLLAPTVLRAERPIYLTRSKNIETVWEEHAKFKAHYYISENIRVFGYEGNLSRAEFATLLQDYKPDLIMADEVHCLSQLSAARTKRFIRYYQEQEKLAPANAQPMLVATSGTLTKRSIKDYEHISRIALRENSPLPFDESELSAWAGVLDAGMDPLLGDLSQLQPLATFNWGADFIKAFGQFNSPDISANYREAFRRRLHTCPGIVTTKEPSVTSSLNLNLWESVEVPAVVDAEIHQLNDAPHLYGLLPPTDAQGPEAYQDYITTFIAEKTNQLMHGFYYTLDWPGGIPDMDYVNARSVWGKLLALELGLNSHTGYDSPALIVEAIEGRGTPRNVNLANNNLDLCAAWRDWKTQRLKPEPPKKIVWVSDYMLHLCRKWLIKNGPGSIVWCAYDAFGEAFAQQPGGIPYYGAGSGKPTAAYAMASQYAHGTGHNLQQYQNNLIISPVLSGAAWEQLLGRTHRQGQEADEVTADILLHTDRYKRKWSEAQKEAQYLEQTTGQKQKILYGTKIKMKGDFMLT
jgi:hypothetical protein